MSEEALFQLLPPSVFDDANVSNLSIPEATLTAYAGGSTYGLGDRVGEVAEVDGAPQAIYESLQAGNIGNTPASSPDWWRFVANVYPEYDVGVTYALDEIVSNIATDVHELYQSLAAGNLGNPLTDSTKWLNISYTNAWAWNDPVYGTQAEQSEQISFDYTPGVVVNTAYFGNLDAASITLTQSISGWTETVELWSHAVLDWYNFYYQLPTRKTDHTFIGIPPYPTAGLTVEIDSPGETPKVGVISIGTSFPIGLTQWDLLGGVISYSGTSTDSFGNTTFVPRANAKRLNFDVRIADGFESEAFRLLTLYTDTPMVFIGSTSYSMAQVYGYLGSWQVPVSNTGKTAPIEVKGLI